MVWPRIAVIFAALAGASAILLAAAGAHMPGLPEASRALIERASFYQLIHAAMLFVMAQHWRPAFRATLVCFVYGVLVFCGGIYLHHLAAHAWLMHAVPSGGIAFALGWFFLLASARFR